MTEQREQTTTPAVRETAPAALTAEEAALLQAWRARKPKRVWMAVLSVVLAAVLLGGGVLLGRQSVRQLPVVPADADAEAFVATHEQLYPNLIPIRDNALGEIWIRRYPGLAENPFAAADFSTVNGVPAYRKDGVHTVFGVDVSEYQGQIDWQKAKAAGVEFAMLRVGYRGYSYGQLHEDSSFLQNLREARAAGVKVGAYFFSQAVTAAEAVEEAQFVLTCLDGAPLDYPVAFDWEPIAYDTARTDEMESEQLTAVCRAFCGTVKAGGYAPMLYMYKAQAYHRYTLGAFADIPFWLADIHETPQFYYRFSLWQYTHEGTVDGIDGMVDLNVGFVRDDGTLVMP